MAQRQDDRSQASPSLLVLVGKEPVLRARLVSVEGHRVRLAAASRGTRRLPVGAAVILGAGLRSDAPRARGLVSSRHDEPARIAYELVLNDAPQPLAELVEALRALLDRREFYRLPRDPRHPLTARLETPDANLSVLAPVLDVSVRGCAVSVAEAVERQLVDLDSLRLVLHLPSGQAVAISARVCHRRLKGDQVHYGLAFLPAQHPEERRSRREVLTYIMDRQRVLLRARSDEGEGKGEP